MEPISKEKSHKTLKTCGYYAYNVKSKKISSKKTIQKYYIDKDYLNYIKSSRYYFSILILSSIV